MELALAKGWNMRKVTVDRQQLLTALRQNKAKHVAEYTEAVRGYKEQATQRLESAIKTARRRLTDAMASIQKRIDAFGDEQLPDVITVLNTECFALKVPRNHEKSYEVAIRMAEMEVADTVELGQDEFQCFVLDDWEWKNEFTAINSTYTKKM